MADIDIQLLQAIRSDMQKIEVVGRNIANATSPGYRAIDSESSAFSVSSENAELQKNSDRSSIIHQYLNSDNGQLDKTGRALDVATKNSAWLQVKTNDVLHLIESAHMEIDSRGYLKVGKSGFVQGQHGDIQIPGGDVNNIKVDSNGEIVVDGRSIDKLHLIRLSESDTAYLNRDGLLIASESQDVEANNESVISGVLRLSNVNPSSEMIKLMELSKHIESTQKAFVTIDQILNTGINQLGNK